MSAALYIGDIRSLLAAVPPGVLVRRISSPPDFREMQEEFSGLAVCPRLLVYDLAGLGGYASIALDFVDSYRGPLVCLSSSDVLEPALSSRFMRVVKSPDIVAHRGVIDKMTFRDDILGEGDRDLTRAIVEYYPPFQRVYYYSRGLPARDTLLGLLL